MSQASGVQESKEVFEGDDITADSVSKSTLPDEINEGELCSIQGCFCAGFVPESANGTCYNCEHSVDVHACTCYTEHLFKE